MQQEVGRVGGQPSECRMQLKRGCRATITQLSRLPVEVGPPRLEVDQVQAVLDQVKAELVAHDRGPVRWPRPAFDREAGVDPEPERRHRSHPVERFAALCTASAALTRLNQSNLIASRRAPALLGVSSSARPTTAAIASAASSFSPAALAASIATPKPAGSRSRCSTRRPSRSALSWPTSLVFAPPP